MLGYCFSNNNVKVYTIVFIIFFSFFYLIDYLQSILVENFK